jgi:adenosylhomocysteine nucleosidase
LSELIDVCILISAGGEWRALLSHYPGVEVHQSPYGEYFCHSIVNRKVSFMHGGWGKVAAAGSTQYAIDRWNPQRIINLGTCGGFEGYIEQGEVILAQKTIIYDIFEQMTDPDQAVEKYSVEFDLSWLPDPPPQPVHPAALLSADRDIIPSDIPWLVEKFHSPAADWESGAIAWVASRNKVPCLILRSVSDVVDESTSEAYGNYAYFEERCQGIMANFAHHLPDWIEAFSE